MLPAIACRMNVAMIVGRRSNAPKERRCLKVRTRRKLRFCGLLFRHLISFHNRKNERHHIHACWTSTYVAVPFQYVPFTQQCTPIGHTLIAYETISTYRISMQRLESVSHSMVKMPSSLRFNLPQQTYISPPTPRHFISVFANLQIL